MRIVISSISRRPIDKSCFANECPYLFCRGQCGVTGNRLSNNNSNNNNNSNSNSNSINNHNQANLYPHMRSSLPGGATLTPGPPHHRSSSSNVLSNVVGGGSGGHSLSTRTGSNLTITPSVTITPTSAPPVGSKSRNVSCKVSASRRRDVT